MPLLILLVLIIALYLLLRLVGPPQDAPDDRELPEASLDEPILAVKRAHVRLRPDGREATLTGLTAGSRYEVDARATCPRGCPVPTARCRCGFYAMHGDPQSRSLSDHAPWARRAEPLSVRLDVELSGTVLEYELGYRAERQRVLQVGVPDRCVPCTSEGEDRQAAGLIARPRTILSPVAAAASGAAYAGDPSLRDWFELRSACLDHLVDDGVGPCLSLSELAALLGTDVTWEASGTAGHVGG